MEKQNQSRHTALFSVIALILLAIAAYLFYQNTQMRKDIIQREREFIELRDIHAELDSQFLEAQQELEAMRDDNEELNQMIDTQLREIEQHKNRITALIRQNKNYDEAREEISELRATVEQYVEEINQLKQENQMLAEENIELKDQTEQLSSSVAMAREENVALQSEREVLSHERDHLTEANIQLSKKVDEAATITVHDIDVRGYATKESGRDVRRRRARNVEKLNICFELEVNQFADEAEEIFYIRLINPAGETIAVESAGSGTLTLTKNDTPIPYSTKLSIEYKHEESEACLEWSPEIPFAEGLYAVEIYNKGFVAGHTTFKLR